VLISTTYVSIFKLFAQVVYVNIFS